MTPVEFPDGRLLVPGVVAGRRQLLVTGSEGDLRPFLGSSDATFPPVAVAASGVAALLTGASGSPPQLGLASVADGRLLKRHALPKGTVPAALAASRDGKTFFFADGGTIYSLDAATGATKKLCAGHGVAGDPGADEVVVQRNAASGVQLVRVALATGVETPVPVSGPLKLAPASLAQGAIGPDRRILVTAISQDTWAPIPAILDPGTGVVTPVPVSYDGEIVATAWGRNGFILGMGLGARGEFWIFRPREPGAP
jgi:hypothetical protein